MISYRKTLLWENISPGRCYKLPCSLPSRFAIIDKCCGEHVGALLAPVKLSFQTNVHTQKCGSKTWAGMGMQFKTVSGLLSRQGEQRLHTSAPSSDIVSQDHLLLIFVTAAYPLWSAAEHILYALSLNIHTLGSILKLLFRTTIHRRLSF